MAITPISSDRNNNRASVVSNMLNRGGRSLSQMLGAAIQLGRNTSDNQFRQEQAFLTEQRREVNLNQRQADAQQQNKEDAQMFEEDKRRFNVKFDQDERFFGERTRQGELDRGIRSRQVEGGLELGAERNEIARQGTAASVFRAETDRAEATARMSQGAARVAQGNQELATQERNRTQRMQAVQTLAKLPPEQRSEGLVQLGLPADFTTKELEILTAGTVAANDEKPFANLGPAQRAEAQGIVNGVEDLQERITKGRYNPEEGTYTPISTSEREAALKSIKQQTAELEKLMGGTRSTADSIFDAARPGQ